MTQENMFATLWNLVFVRPPSHLPRGYFSLVVGAMLCLEALLCAVIIKKISYTEIDWVAYMQEVQGYLGGELNYEKLGGDTGPLVYPAGFVYVFALLYWATDMGSNILRGQAIFAVIYVIHAAVVFALYSQSERVPLLGYVMLILSKRVHSIFVLRMFNDCIAALCGYVAVLLFTKRSWRLGCLIYSFGVAVKMNMLLLAPGILLILLMGTGIQETFICLSICAGLQLALGWPFLTTHPVEYMSRAFQLSRVFKFEWTVNFKFLPEEVFVSKELSILLLVMTILSIIIFAAKWIRENSIKNRTSSGNSSNDVEREKSTTIGLLGPQMLDSHFIITTIFTSNFIGVVFARTLHYQFYSWYFHMLPLLLWHTSLPTFVRIAVLAAIEYSFNVFPATPFSSSVLQAAHLLLLFALWVSPAPLASADKFAQKKI